MLPEDLEDNTKITPNKVNNLIFQYTNIQIYIFFIKKNY